MDSLIPYAVVDILLLVAIIVMMGSKLTFWHPVTAYLFFHIYAFTTRCLALIGGSLPMYADTPLIRDQILPAELERAMICADLALVLFCLGSAIGQFKADKQRFRPVLRKPLSRNVVLAIVSVCLPVGAVAFYSIKSGLQVSAVVAESSYYQTMVMWPIACLGVLVYLYGFRWFLLIPIGIYLSIVGLQGYHRVMLVLPLLFFSAYYLQANRKKWPGLRLLIPGTLLLILFPSLKFVGRAYEAGDYNEVSRLVKESFSRPDDKKYDGSGEQFLDQYAGALTMVDEYEKKYMGSIYIAIVTLPVPRAMWANKPGLADHLAEVSTTRRPYNQEGRIITYIGEAYFNFGYFGILAVPFIVGYGLTYWCVIATAGPLLRFNRYLYTVFCVAFIQVYRDGMVSLLLFTVIHHLPIMFIWIAHYIPGVVRSVEDPPEDHPLSLDVNHFRNS